MPPYDSNLYNNPQMGNFGGNPQPQVLSPGDAQWYSQYSAPGSTWQNIGEIPGSFGGSSWFDPQTGQSSNQSGDVLSGYYGNSNAIRSTNPQTGESYVNIPMMIGMFGGSYGSGGGAEYQAYDPTAFAGGQINAPGAYGGGDWNTSGMVDPSAVIDAYRPTMQANIDQGFAEAGNRLGQSGFGMSTAYANALGNVERLARAQMNQRGLEYSYNAAEAERAREQQAMMARNAETFGAWQQAGDWDIGAQGMNAQNAYNQWLAENQWGFQGNQQQNQFNQQQSMNDQMMQQQMLASLLGGLL